jgi:hypothetical protein
VHLLHNGEKRIFHCKPIENKIVLTPSNSSKPNEPRTA